MNESRFLSWITIIVLLTSIITFWFYRLDCLPGLHGDEAWFGLKAFEYLGTGIDKPYGMRNYTGILQALAVSIAFKYFDIGIFQLRTGGLLFNVISLTILTFYFICKVNQKSAVILLLLFSQSALYMIYPKIAWEVNSFNLFLVVLFLISSLEIAQMEGGSNIGLNFVFLGSCFLGTYNHIIFSCLPVSVFSGLVIWMLYNKNFKYMVLVSMLFINCINIIILYLLTQTIVDQLWHFLNNRLFILIVMLIVLESVFLQQLTDYVLPKLTAILNKIVIPGFSIKYLLVIASVIFLLLHGVTFWQIATNKVLLLRVYSYEPPLWLNILFIISGSMILMYIIGCLIIDILKNSDQPWAFIIVAYLGLFSIYAADTSIRYYLTIFAIIFIYMSYKMTCKQKTAMIHNGITCMLVLAFMLIQSTLWILSSNTHRELRALHFPLGHTRVETSAHFLPFEPVMEFLYKSRAGKISTSEKFFIGNTFNFYKLIHPEINKLPGTASIEYDYVTYGDGFKKVLIHPY